MTHRKRKFNKAVHGPQVEAIAQAAAAQPFRLEEIGNTYCGPRDRFVVSLVVGYAEDDGCKTAKTAAAAALKLTTDDGSPDTHWYVYDRKTGELHQFEQSDFDGVYVP